MDLGTGGIFHDGGWWNSYLASICCVMFLVFKEWEIHINPPMTSNDWGIYAGECIFFLAGPSEATRILRGRQRSKLQCAGRGGCLLSSRWGGGWWRNFEA